MQIVQDDPLFSADDPRQDRTFAALFERNYARLVYFAYQIIKDRPESEDIVQNAFITCWNAKELVGKEERSVKSYLYTTVRNSCLDLLKHRAVALKYQTQLDPDPKEESTVENEIIRAEVLAELFDSIEQLPQGCKQVLEMSFLFGKKNQEIADELQISVNTVKTQKQRAIQLLKSKLMAKSVAILLLLLSSDLP